MLFKIDKIKENIYKISEPYFKEHANIFIVKGKKFDLVVDSGMGLENLKEFLLKKKIMNPKVFITHGHFDHIGGMKFFEPNELLICGKVAENLSNKKLFGLEYLHDKDFDINIGKKLGVNVKEFCKKFNVDKIKKPSIYKKNVISNGTYSFEIIHTPGHTDDSYILFDKKNKIIITGDTLYNGKIYMTMKNSDKKSFFKFLKKIQGLDFNLVLPGHNKVMNKKQALVIIEMWLKALRG